MSPLNTVFKFDPNGKMVASFGQGMFVFPHGIHVDRDGNIWVTDGQSNLPRRASRPAGRRAAAADARQGRRPPGREVQPARARCC